MRPYGGAGDCLRPAAGGSFAPMPATCATPPTGDSRRFERRIDALADIVAYTSAVFDRRGFDRALLPAVEFAIEELFTNAVKYGAGSTSPVTIDIAAIAGGVEVTVLDPDVPRFDVTRAPDADLTLPLEQRVPGGLGLHLTRRLVDALEYTYSPERRESRIIFRKTAPGTSPAADTTGGNDADDRIGGVMASWWSPGGSMPPRPRPPRPSWTGCRERSRWTPAGSSTSPAPASACC